MDDVIYLFICVCLDILAPQSYSELVEHFLPVLQAHASHKLKPHVTSQSLISIYCAIVYPYLTYGCVLWGNNYEAPLSQLVRLQNKAVRIINNVPLRDHITPHYVNLGLIKLPDIVKLYTCQLFYDHLINKKSSNLNLSLVSEQHNYATRSASLQHLNPGSFRINIRKFCPTIVGCYYWNDIPLPIRNKPTTKLFKKALLFCSVLTIPILYAFTFSSLVYFYPNTNEVN